MELAKVTSKGQITIPVEIRRKFKLEGGSKVLFIEDGNRVYFMNAATVAVSDAGSYEKNEAKDERKKKSGKK